MEKEEISERRDRDQYSEKVRHTDSHRLRWEAETAAGRGRGRPTWGRVYPRKQVVFVRARGTPMGTRASSRCASCRTASV